MMPDVGNCCVTGIVNLSQSELFRQVTLTSKPLKVRDLPQANNTHNAGEAR